MGSTGGSVSISISISISVGGEIIKGVGSKLGKDAVSDLTGAVLGGYIGEKTGNAVKDELDKKDKTDAKK